MTLKIGPPHGIYIHVAMTKKFGAEIRAEEKFIPLSKSGSTESFFYKLIYVRFVHKFC